MRIHLPILLGSLFVACVHARPFPAYVPPEEAAWFKFPHALPEAGQQTIPGSMAAAIQMAMDDFLPRDNKFDRSAPPQEICLRQRQSYDIEASSGPGKLIAVNISLAPGACTWGPGPLLDIGATYTVDTTGWRILEEAAGAEAPPSAPSKEAAQRIEGNMAGAIQLSMDDFLPREAPPPRAPLPQEPCLRNRESYDVTAVPIPEGVILVRFNLNSAVCAPTEQLIDITTYAIDVRTMRILSRERHTRPNPAFRLQPEAPDPLPGAAPPPEASLPPTEPSGSEAALDANGRDVREDVVVPYP
jgi:hypothetical protein